MRADLDGIATPRTPSVPLRLRTARHRRRRAWGWTLVAIVALALVLAGVMALLANLLSISTP